MDAPISTPWVSFSSSSWQTGCRTTSTSFRCTRCPGDRPAGAVAAGVYRHVFPRRRRYHRGQGAREGQARRYASAGDLASDKGATCAEKRSWPGPRRRYISYASLPGETKGWWPEYQALSWRSSRERSFRSSLPCGPKRMLGWRSNGSEWPRSRATAPDRGLGCRHSRHDVDDAARHLKAAPEALREWEWRHLCTRLDESIAMFPAKAGETQFLVRVPQGIRIARLKPAGLYLADLEGNELWTHSFPAVDNLMVYPPLFTRQGLRLFAKIKETGKTPNNIKYNYAFNELFLNIVSDQGRVQKQLKSPEGTDTLLVAVNPEGSRLAVFRIGPTKAAFTLYDSDTGEPRVTSDREIGYAYTLVFSPDGTRVATGGEDGLTRLWDTSTGAMTALCRGHTRKVMSVAFRRDGLRLATASADGTVRQWDSTSGREVEPSYDRHTGEVMTAKYSADGAWIASGGTDRTVRVWGAADRQDIVVLQGHTGDVRDLEFIDDGRRLASASQMPTLGHLEQQDGTVRFWEIGRHGAASVLRGHTSYIYPVEYSPDGRWIASGSWDNTVRLWDALTGETAAILPHPGNIRALAFSPDSSWLVSACFTDPDCRIWDVATARLRTKVKGPGSVVAQTVAISAGRNPHRGCRRQRPRHSHRSRDRRLRRFLSYRPGRRQEVTVLQSRRTAARGYG